MIRTCCAAILMALLFAGCAGDTRHKMILITPNPLPPRP